MTTLTATSQYGTRGVVHLDPWAVNPLLDDAQQSVPALVTVATRTNGEPPTVFESGALPPFTASGVDPRHLASLPWKTRHAAAVAPDAATVLGMVEQYANNGDGELPAAGLSDYITRFSAWLSGSWTNPAHTAPTDTDDGEVFDSLFAAADAARAAKIAQTNAADANFRAMKAGTGKYARPQG